MSPRARLLPLLAPALLAGCHSYLVPFDERPLLARQPVETASGLRLDVDPRDGLQVRPAAGDVSTVLGVGLEETEDGLVVTHRLRPDAQLQPDDRVVHVAAALPRMGARILELHRAMVQGTRTPATELKWQPGAGSPSAEERHPIETFEPAAARRADDEGEEQPLIPPVPTPAALREARAGHPVRAADDLRGYLTAPGVALDLLVVRGGEEVVVRVPLVEPHRWLPVRLWAPHLTRWHGIDLVRVADLAPEHQPAGAGPRDFLVVRVARDAPAGRAGLRPLDVVPEGEVVGLLGGALEVLVHLLRPRDPEELRRLMEGGGELPLNPRDYFDEDGAPLRRPDEVAVRVRAPDGTTKAMAFSPREQPTELWFPFLFAYHSDGVRSHLGLGPLDLLFHHSARGDYDPEADAYEYVTRWAVGSSIEGGGVTHARGTQGWGGVSPLVMRARADYFFDWLSVPEETRRRRGW